MDHLKIEKKWQDYWYSKNLFHAEDFSKKPKYYCLIEFPYPSGAGMHVGHVRAFSSLEVVARKRRMEGYNVLYPIGFDAFGLPTENYAIKNNVHPRIVTDKNIATFTDQLKRCGFSFDYDRVVDTTDDKYYHWTQYIFLKMFNKGLAYRSHTYVNFCPTCKVVLSNEESQGGVCDRCGSDVIQKEKDVWFLRITKYAQKLLDGLEGLDASNRIKTEQENWIGRSEGAFINFNLKQVDDKFTVFTTRPDTLFGAMFMVIAPEHPLIEKYASKIKNLDEVKDYQEKATHKTEFERVQLQKDKTGVKLDGISAVNPVNKRELPIYISDYVMMGYGTGAIMAVPAHDTRDYAFAKKFNIPMMEVIKGGDITKEAYTDIEQGILVNSDFLDGLSVKDAKAKMIEYLVQNNLGDKAVNYKMKDWAFNRQRYWGEPIPIIYCPNCGIVGVPYEDLPVRLPNIKNFEPNKDGESPLASLKEFTECTCPKCGSKARRETDTMPQWAGSSWYFLRYTDPKNENAIADFEKMKYWLPVDWYNGGMEHVTRHLIYSRFWNEFLYDEGLVPCSEPYKKRTAQGLILGPDGEKMSKSKGNVIDPISVINEYGADVLRCYILFISDYEMATPWNSDAIKGCARFLDKVESLNAKVNKDINEFTPSLKVLINKTIKEVSDDIESSKFNTGISKLMILTNALLEKDSITLKDYETLLKLLNPYCPHIAEELWHNYHDDTIQFAEYPKYDENSLVEDTCVIVVSVNGKMRDKFNFKRDASNEEVTEAALSLDKIKAYTENGYKKIIVVKNKLINIVV
ncbi:MAG: leucine--tRNA ligase [Gammaproteobacteria bacterium]|nr:leucine--tRNA ligase [Gammaproteobacteria bacterium]